MYSPKTIVFFVACLVMCCSARANTNFQDTSYKKSITVVKDTTVYVKSDTGVRKECNDQFFQQGDKITATAKTMLITKDKKTVTLKSFMQKLTTEPDHVLADLDHDGKKELVITDFTGGAHCCDEYYVFRNIGPNKYQYVNKTF